MPLILGLKSGSRRLQNAWPRLAGQRHSLKCGLFYRLDLIFFSKALYEKLPHVLGEVKSGEEIRKTVAQEAQGVPRKRGTEYLLCHNVEHARPIRRTSPNQFP